MQAAQPQYDFFSEENGPKWRGLLVPSLEKVNTHTNPNRDTQTDLQVCAGELCVSLRCSEQVFVSPESTLGLWCIVVTEHHGGRQVKLHRTMTRASSEPCVEADP